MQMKSKFKKLLQISLVLFLMQNKSNDVWCFTNHLLWRILNITWNMLWMPFSYIPFLLNTQIRISLSIFFIKIYIKCECIFQCAWCSVAVWCFFICGVYVQSALQRSLYKQQYRHSITTCFSTIHDGYQTMSKRSILNDKHILLS